ncbi:MAG: hypothetical protein QOC83_1957 [Pseudonocardiales bacterium]|jgi:hypothetical protein|nr:hypothetical protein [Pseudonocardiales bacterium]
MHHPWNAAGAHTDGPLVFRVRGPVSGLVGSDGLDREWPGQPAGSDQPACRVSSDAERLADEKADRTAHDEHDDQEAEAPHQLLSNPPKTGDVATTP